MWVRPLEFIKIIQNLVQRMQLLTLQLPMFTLLSKSLESVLLCNKR